MTLTTCWYIGYVLFIYLIQIISEQIEAIAIAQYLLSFAATLALYGASVLLFENRKSALIASLCYILFLDLMSWNSYILCESFYTSMLCFSFLGLVKFHLNKRSFSNALLLIVTILITVISKPTGITLVVAIGAVFIYKGALLITSRAFKVFISILMVSCTLLLINKMLTTYTIVDNDYKKGEIIYGITSLPDKLEYQSLKVTPPDDLTLPPKQEAPLIRIASFIIQNPVYWLEMLSKKVFFLLSHIRPYWSIWHNLYVLAFLIPTYIFSLKYLFNREFSVSLKTFIFTYLAMHISIVGVTTAEWDGRFILPMLPVLFMIVSQSFVMSWDKWAMNRKPTS
ncbi:MAG: hypothetical protein JXR03_01270 [Cyclobacteriaceae bacterium]